MKYLLTIYGDESLRGETSPEQLKEMMEAYAEYGREVEEAGIHLGGEGLQDSSTATTVQVRGGERIVTDGPFAETKEQLGGFYLLECKDLDDAVDWAAKIPGAQGGSIEVRPVMDYEAINTQIAAATEARS